MSTFGTNTYGDNVYGGPAVWSESLTEAGSAADALDATISFALTGVGCAAQIGGSSIVDEIVLTGVGATAHAGTSDGTVLYILQGVECAAETPAPPAAVTAYGADLYGVGPYSAPMLVELSVPLPGVSATAQAGASYETASYALRGVECAAESAPDPQVELLIPLTGVSATAQAGKVSHAGFPGPRTFFIASTTQQVIAPGMQMYPTSDTINLGSSPYMAGSSQFYTIGQVIWNGAVKTKGVDWEFVAPFTHIIRILNQGAYGGGRYGLSDYSAGAVPGTPITLVYSRWNIQVTAGFTVTSYPVPFSFIGTTIVAEQAAPIDQYFSVNFIANRIANNPQTLFSIFPVMVDDMLPDHTAYDEPYGFQTYRPDCYQVLDMGLMQIFEWTSSSWVVIRDVSNGTSFYVKSLRAVYENQEGVAVLKYTAGDGPSDSYPQAITYPPFGEGIGKNLLVDGFSAEAPTRYPAAYQVVSSPGPYDSVCQEEQGFDRGFDRSFT